MKTRISILFSICYISSFGQGVAPNDITISNNQPVLNLVNTSSSIYSKARIAFDQQGINGKKFWLFSEIGSSTLANFYLRGLNGGDFVNYFLIQGTDNSIRIFPSKSASESYGQLILNHGNFKVEEGNVNIDRGNITVSNETSGQIKIQGDGGSPSWRARLLLDRKDDFRGAGTWITSSNGSENDWFSGVPYTGAGYSIGYHASQPHYDDNSFLFIEPNGYIGIGTSTPDNELTVNGTIHAEEVLVDLNVEGPDYVFEEDYDLTSLEELDSYLKENKHLPEVPSAAQMKEEGVNMVEMDMLLLKKVEELTLHLIEQNIKNDKLEAQNIELLKELKDLQQRVQKLEFK